MKKFTALLFNLIVALTVTTAMGAPAVVGIGIALLSGFMPGLPAGSFGMALQKEIWQADIVANLFADNTFLSKAYNADMYVLAGKVVHVPQAGTFSTVVKNRTSLPGTVSKRTDSEVTYSLDEYTTDPRLIQDTEKVELSYDKRQSVIAEDQAGLIEAISEEMLYKWSPTVSTAMVRTSGTDVVAHLPSATGNRKLITPADVNAAALILNKQNIPKAGRYAILDSNMYAQLLDAMSANAQRDFIAGADPVNGVIGKYAGFSFFERSTVSIYTNAATPALKAIGAAAAATDNAGGIFWQELSVERALGMVKAFDNPGDATYYGDILSFLVRAGGRIRRADNKGVVAVIQAAGS